MSVGGVRFITCMHMGANQTVIECVLKIMIRLGIEQDFSSCSFMDAALRISARMTSDMSCGWARRYGIHTRHVE